MSVRVASRKTIAVTGLFLAAATVALLACFQPLARYDFALLLQAIEPDDHRALTGCMFPAYPGPLSAAEVVATALEVPPEAVRIDGIHAICPGINHATATIEGERGHPRQVHVGYEAATGLLRSIHWNGRAIEAPSSADELVPMDAARRTAQELMVRLLPPVPVEMKLVSEEPSGITLIDGEAHAIYYVFRWEAEVEDGAQTGDSASVYVCRLGGEPYRYAQRLAPLRPEPAEIAITREEAMQIALDPAEPATVQIDEARLMLSSLVSPEQGPVWFMTATGQSDHSASAEARRLAVDAMTGEVLLR